MTSIGDGAFEWCSGLTSVDIPNGVTSIGDYAFSGCSGLTSVIIPNSLTTISQGTFSGCSGLNSLVIPNNVTSIGEHAFSGCSGLNSLVIPNSMTSIGDGAFGHCSGLASIVVESGNAKYNSHNDCNAIIETVTNTLIAGCKNTAIPNSVTSIGDYAFSGCSGLTSVIIPSSVTSIGGYAFSNCSNLSYITIGKSVSRIEKFAFCSTQKLKHIKLLCSAPPTLSDYPFPTFDSYTATLEVPIGSKESYQNAEIWKKFMNIEEFDPTGIQNTTLDMDNPKGIYDISGRKLKEPRKGVNIIGGKKVLKH